MELSLKLKVVRESARRAGRKAGRGAERRPAGSAAQVTESAPCDGCEAEDPRLTI